MQSLPKEQRLLLCTDLFSHKKVLQVKASFYHSSAGQNGVKVIPTTSSLFAIIVTVVKWTMLFF